MVVLVVAAAAKLDIQEQCIWMTYGIGKNLRYVAVHEIAASLGTDESQALSLFHMILH